MKDLFEKVFGKSDGESGGEPAARQAGDIRIATCALFLEIANIDNEFSEEERQHILSILQDEYQLSEDDALALANRAMDELQGSIDMWQFTNQINDNYSDDEKMRVVELLWQVVYADGTLDAHEDYLVHRLAKLLRLSNKQLIDAKLRVLQRNREGGD